METIECKNCGSSALELVGNEYVCQACGSRFQASELFSTPQSESTAQLSENERAELKRLKANLKDDHSLSKRVLELDPYDWEAYFYAYNIDYRDKFDKWLVCLQRSGLPVKEIEKILNAYYYEEQKKETINWHLNILKSAIDSSDPQTSYFELALKYLSDFKKNIHSNGIHIKSILGEEYSSLVQKWEEDCDDTCVRYTKELQNKRNMHEEKKRRLEENSRLQSKTNIAHGLASVIIGIILFIVGLVLTISCDSAVWIAIGGLGCLALLLIGVSRLNRS